MGPYIDKIIQFFIQHQTQSLHSISYWTLNVNLLIFFLFDILVIHSDEEKRFYFIFWYRDHRLYIFKLVNTIIHTLFGETHGSHLNKTALKAFNNLVRIYLRTSYLFNRNTHFNTIKWLLYSYFLCLYDSFYVF